MFDEALLTKVTIDAALADLTPIERDVIRMLFAYDQPADYTGQWPPTLGQVGVYVGTKYQHGRAMSDGRVAKLRDTILAKWSPHVGE